jgi:hypothetical protein
LEPPKAAGAGGGVPDPAEEPLLLLEQPTPQTIKAKATKVRTIKSATSVSTVSIIRCVLGY